MSNYKDLKHKNLVDKGIIGTTLATGTTAQRGSGVGQFRYNTTTGKFEGRNASAFVSIEPTPIVTSIDDTEVDSAGGGNQTFVITGTNFATGDIASFVGADASTFNASTTTVDSVTQITAVVPKVSFLNAQEPYDVKVTSSGGLSGVLDNQINVDNAPTWTTGAGSLGTVEEDATGNHFTLVASDAEGDAVTYAETGGSNITGAGLALSSAGVISGDPTDVGADTTVSFDVRATAGGKTADRSFSLIVANNPLGGVTEVWNSNTSGIASITTANGVSDVTSNIASLTGISGWTGTKLHYLANSGNCGNWYNIVNNMNTSSGGVTVCLWGKTISPNNISRPYETYQVISEYQNFKSNKYEVNTCFSGGDLNIRTLTGNGSWSIDDWHFYCFRYSTGMTSSSQTAKFTTDASNGGALHTQSWTGACGANTAAQSGFMGHDPSGTAGVNTYNWEGYTGGWRVFNADLSDAQVAFVYNSGNGRF
jgi:hypothetical protein